MRSRSILPTLETMRPYGSPMTPVRRIDPKSAEGRQIAVDAVAELRAKKRRTHFPHLGKTGWRTRFEDTTQIRRGEIGIAPPFQTKRLP